MRPNILPERTLPPRFSLLSSLSLAIVAGCSSQASTDYQGEPLATISGAVQTDSAPAPTSPIDAAVVWAQVQFSANQQIVQSVQWVGESTPVAGQFPAQFTLSIFQPPPDGVMIPCASSSAHVAFGFVVAVNAGANLAMGNALQDVVGEAYDYMLLYLDADQPAGWSCEPGLGFTFAPTKGYHLMAQVPNSIQPRFAEAVYPAYVEAPNGFATQVTVTLGTSEGGPGVGGTTSTSWCTSECEEKAASCGAPSSEARSDCSSLCAAPITEDQLDCIDTSDCTALVQAAKTGMPTCGVLFETTEDAGAKTPTAGDAAVAND